MQIFWYQFEMLWISMYNYCCLVHCTRRFSFPNLSCCLSTSQKILRLNCTNECHKTWNDWPLTKRVIYASFSGAVESIFSTRSWIIFSSFARFSKRFSLAVHAVLKASSRFAILAKLSFSILASFATCSASAFICVCFASPFGKAEFLPVEVASCTPSIRKYFSLLATIFFANFVSFFWLNWLNDLLLLFLQKYISA